MTYWHMQLHPDHKNFGKEKEILREKGVIGLTKDKNDFQLSQFEKEMNINDIVLIRIGKNTPSYKYIDEIYKSINVKRSMIPGVPFRFNIISINEDKKISVETREREKISMHYKLKR